MEEQLKKEIIDEVTTINGVIKEKQDCRRIGGNYYIIGDINIKDSGDCYYINDKYYRIETGYITYDYEKEKYVIKNHSDLANGVVEIIDNKLIYGYFTPVKFKNVYVYSGGDKIISLSADIFKSTNKFREQLRDGIFYDINDIEAINFNKKVKPKSEYKRSLPYNCKYIIKNYINNYNNNDIQLNSTVDKYGSVIRDLSFGLEFETIKGLIPDRLSKPLGLIPLRDGSISGIEYVTIPLSGKKGLQAIVNSCNLLKQRTSYDDSCALHLHIGGIPRTMEFILALYKTLVHIQDEVYRMFPLYKKYNFGVKQNDYTKQIPSDILLNQMDKVIDKNNIVDNFDVLFKYLSQGVSFKGNHSSLDTVDSHPSDPRGNRKWQVSTRYAWCNVIPLIFDNKQTVEFRIHTPTFEVNKVLNYVVICSNIINFVKDNTTGILSDYKRTLQGHSLQSIMEKSIYSSLDITSDDKYRLYSSINSYIRNRIESTYSQNCQGNVKGDESAISSYSNINWNKPIKNNTIKTENNGFNLDKIVYKSVDFDAARERLEQLIRRRNMEIEPVAVGFDDLDNNLIEDE